jgi:serine carboxypeptidase-like clade 1
VQIANIIFVDAPVGTGFSYSTTWEGYQVSDTLSAAESYEFLRKVRESVFLNRKI